VKLSLPFGRGERMTFEHSMLRTATFCLLALGAIMVYSASSGTSLLAEGGTDSSFYLKRYVGSAILGLVVLSLVSRAGLDAVRRMTPLLLAASIAGLVLVLLPGFGIEAGGARRWLGAGPLQVQPSEVAKLALVLYAAGLIAADPARTRSLYGMRPLLVIGALMGALVVVEPDLGTAIVIALTLGAMLVVGGVKPRHLVFLAGALAVLALLAILIEPYRRERLLSFLNPWSDSAGSGFQSVQAMIAIGSGGLFGVGLGESVQKLFYLPEAHTDMILAVIGEELGLAGICGVLFLYGMIAYAGLRAARTARDLYAKLVAAGITSVILCQAAINVFAVLGVLPLTGVPLPFISYGNSNLIVMLGAMGILINVAQHGSVTARAGGKGKRGLRVLDGGRGSGAGQAVIRKITHADDRDRSRRNSRARGSGAGGRRRASR
jgi:cell division protein FtsW